MDSAWKPWRNHFVRSVELVVGHFGPLWFRGCMWLRKCIKKFRSQTSCARQQLTPATWHTKWSHESSGPGLAPHSPTCLSGGQVGKGEPIRWRIRSSDLSVTRAGQDRSKVPWSDPGGSSQLRQGAIQGWPKRWVGSLPNSMRTAAV